MDWAASTASPSRSCRPDSISVSRALWYTWAASFTLRPLGEKAAMAPRPSALTKASASESRGGKWKKPFRQFKVSKRGCFSWAASVATSVLFQTFSLAQTAVAPWPT